MPTCYAERVLKNFYLTLIVLAFFTNQRPLFAQEVVTYEPNILLAHTNTDADDEPITIIDEPETEDPAPADQAPAAEQPVTQTPAMQANNTTTSPTNETTQQQTADVTTGEISIAEEYEDIPEAENTETNGQVLGTETSAPSLVKVKNFASDSRVALDSQIATHPVRYAGVMLATLFALIILALQRRYDKKHAKFYNNLTLHRLHI